MYNTMRKVLVLTNYNTILKSQCKICFGAMMQRTTQESLKQLNYEQTMNKGLLASNINNLSSIITTQKQQIPNMNNIGHVIK